MTDILGGVDVSVNGDINTLSDLPAATTLTVDQLISLRERLLVRMHNLVNGFVDYSEHGDTGHTMNASRTIAVLKSQIELLNDMITNPELVDTEMVAIYLLEFDNPAV